MMMYGMGMYGIFFWILIIGLIIWGVSLIMRSNRYSGSADPRLPDNSPLEILKQRYARGEITKEQFEEMKRDLLN